MFRAYSCPSSGATTTAVAASGLLSELGGSSAVGRGWAGRPDYDQQHCYHHAPMINQRLLLQSLWLLMMGMRMPETRAESKRQAINLRSCCILLVDSIERTWPCLKYSMNICLEDLSINMRNLHQYNQCCYQYYKYLPLNM
jgi:hypothetical protein